MNEGAPVPIPLGPGRFRVREPGRKMADTNLSKSVQNSFTHWRRGRGILRMSIREAANLDRHSLPIFLFLFYPLYFVNYRESPVSVPPRMRGIFVGKTREGRKNIVQNPFTGSSNPVHTFLAAR